MRDDEAISTESNSTRVDPTAIDLFAGVDREDVPTEAPTHAIALEARGHEHVRATHASTAEVTTEHFLTPAGDCILAIDAPIAPADLPAGLARALGEASSTVALGLAVEELADAIVGRGDPRVTLESERSLVARTSEYVDERTVLVGADRAAADVDRRLVDRLALGAPVTVALAAWRTDRPGEPNTEV